MTQAAPKRYVHALIRHFIIFSLFLPTFYSHFQHEYYQDVFFSNIIALLFVIVALGRWQLDLKQNLPCVAVLSLLLLGYNGVCIYNYLHYTELTFWKTYQLNITVSFLFFVTLLLIKDHKNIITDKVIRLTMWTIVINNLIALIFYAKGYRRIKMMNLTHEKIPFSPEESSFSWLYQDAGEYALILLLSMAFFIIYKDLFHNIWTYLLSHAVLILCLYLTGCKSAYVSVLILFACQLIHHLLIRFQIRKIYIYLSFIPAALAGGVTAYYLFTHIKTLTTKFYIWQGTWKMLLEDPVGLRSTFGPHIYYVDYVPKPLTHASNVFLNHMLRYSLPAGILFALMFAVIILCALLRRPNYLTIGIWLALLISMTLEYSLQTVNLPFVLFMIYCIFYRNQKRA